MNQRQTKKPLMQASPLSAPAYTAVSSDLPNPTAPFSSLLPFHKTPCTSRVALSTSSTTRRARHQNHDEDKSAMMALSQKIIAITRQAIRQVGSIAKTDKTPDQALDKALGIIKRPIAALSAQAPSTHNTDLTLAAINPVTEHTYSASWARTGEELRAAQALRWQVFAVEMDARLSSPKPGLDIDPFDRFCEHLLVKDSAGNVVGTYRALLPEQADQLCGWYSSTEFHLKPLQPHAARVMEVGRSCVHPDHRNGTVMMMLWQELARFMDSRGLDWLFGCASVPMKGDQGLMAASLWQHFVDHQRLDTEVFCKPRKPLDVEMHNARIDASQLQMPPLLKGYLRLGAAIASAPAVDEQFGCADFLVLLRKQDITPRYARHFFGPATRQFQMS